MAMLVSLTSHAETDSAAKRFIPLDRQRDSIPIRAKSAQSSDRESLASGAFRSDRTRPIPLNRAPLVPIAITPEQRPASPTVREPDAPELPRVIQGNKPLSVDNEEPLGSAGSDADPVLSLFDSNQAAPLGSFRDALLGKMGGDTQRPRSSNTHRWPLPLSASQTFTSGFGPRSDPMDGSSEFHGGIDIAAATGTPVLATADGGVLKVGSDSRYGKYIAILHADGSESHYGHLSGQQVREGDLVRAGQRIGSLGATGRVTGAHLDYRIKRDGVRIDPMSVLKAPENIAYAKGESRTKPAYGVSVVSGREKTQRDAKSFRLITVR